MSKDRAPDDGSSSLAPTKIGEGIGDLSGDLSQDLHTLPEQMPIIDYLVGLLGARLRIPEGPLRGLIWLEAKQWQVERGHAASAIRGMPPEERIEAVGEIAGRVRARIARHYPRDRHPELEEAFRAMLDDYARTWARDVEPVG